jgi:peptidoglycan/LPS O-acetylase OafA/YrhL
VKQPYLNTLTWLRAFAAFFVVVSHAIRTSAVAYAPNDEGSYFLPINLLDLGIFGVYLFFALSGCTLYISNHNKIRNINDLIPFYTKRFFRIWPAFAISLAIYLIFIEFFRHFYHSNPEFWIAQFLKEYKISDVFIYLTLTFNLTGPEALFIGPYWSLPVEFQYYLLLPFALFLAKTKRLSFLSPLIFGSVLYMLYSKQIFSVDRTEVFKMGFVFFGGVLIAQYYQKIPFKLTFSMSAIAFALIILFAGTIRTKILVVPESIPFISDKWNVYGLLSLLSLILALITLPPSRDYKLLSFIHKYGTISYSIYLFHMLFLGVAALLVIQFEIYGYAPKLLFVLSFSLIGSYFFSIFTYKYIELTFIRIGRRLTKT